MFVLIIFQDLPLSFHLSPSVKPHKILLWFFFLFIKMQPQCHSQTQPQNIFNISWTTQVHGKLVSVSTRRLASDVDEKFCMDFLHKTSSWKLSGCWTWRELRNFVLNSWNVVVPRMTTDCSLRCHICDQVFFDLVINVVW